MLEQSVIYCRFMISQKVYLFLYNLNLENKMRAKTNLKNYEDVYSGPFRQELVNFVGDIMA